MLIRSNAFTNVKKHLKGDLHCHTTRSDGKGSPEEVMRLLADNGYNFAAITDHGNYNFKNYAPETGLTIIPAMEHHALLPEEGIHCYHIVCIGPEHDNGYTQDERKSAMRATCQKDVQELIDNDILARNNMAILCHPEWSHTDPSEFNELTGFFAMEVRNSVCTIENAADLNNGTYWDTLLVKGKKVWGVASDDGHGLHHFCHAWVMVNCENNVDAILAALKEGAFYASTGPEIHDFYVEDGKAVVDCSPCAEVRFCYGYFPPQRRLAKDTEMTHAEYTVPSYNTYIRAEVIDKDGNIAWTNPIFFEK